MPSDINAIIYKLLKSARCTQAEHSDIRLIHYESSGQRNIEGANKSESKHWEGHKKPFYNCDC